MFSHLYLSGSLGVKQSRQWRQRKRHLKRVFFIAGYYSISFNLWYVDQFFWSKILMVWFWVKKKTKRKQLSWVHVLPKTWHTEVSRRSRATTAKKYTKKRHAHAKLFNLLLFCRSRYRRFLSCFKQQRRRRLRKHYFTSIKIRAASSFIALIPSCSVRQMLENFSGVEFSRLYRNSGKEKGSRCLCVHVLHKTWN